MCDLEKEFGGREFPTRGKVSVIKIGRLQALGWFVFSPTSPGCGYYLHKDLLWYKSTGGESSGWQGYWTSETEAKNGLEDWKKKFEDSDQEPDSLPDLRVYVDEMGLSLRILCLSCYEDKRRTWRKRFELEPSHKLGGWRSRCQLCCLEGRIKKEG